ncbi:MAG: hypothetical protein QM817_00065 [Archangium sp.]
MLRDALAAWRAARTDENAQWVEDEGRAAAREHNPNAWDLASFDEERLPWVLDWLPTAPAGMRLAVLKHLETVVPDPRLTPVLLRLLGTALTPLERASVVVRLSDNADPREEAVALRLGVDAPRRTARAEEAKLRLYLRERDGVLAAMFERVNDLGARQVAADWLSGFDDPLGELMTLQLSGGGDARVQELLTAHHDLWVYDLFAPEPVRELAFELGVPIALEVARPIQWKPACAGVREVRVIDGNTRWLESAPWQGVRLVNPVPRLVASELETSDAGRLAQFSEFEVRGGEGDRTVAAIFLHQDGVLEFVAPMQPAPWHWLEPVLRVHTPARLELSLPQGGPPPPAFLAEATVRRRTVDELRGLAWFRHDELRQRLQFPARRRGRWRRG